MNVFKKIYRFFVPTEEIEYEAPDYTTQTQRVHRKVNGKIKNTVVIHFFTKEQVDKLHAAQKEMQFDANPSTKIIKRRSSKKTKSKE